jgi:hypothetical protein
MLLAVVAAIAVAAQPASSAPNCPEAGCFYYTKGAQCPDQGVCQTAPNPCFMMTWGQCGIPQPMGIYCDYSGAINCRA